MKTDRSFHEDLNRDEKRVESINGNVVPTLSSSYLSIKQRRTGNFKNYPRFALTCEGVTPSLRAPQYEVGS